MICKFIEDNDVVPPTKRKVYDGAQSPDCCIVTGGCMMGEKETLNSKVGKSLFDFLKKVEMNGLDVDDEDDEEVQRSVTISISQAELCEMF